MGHKPRQASLGIKSYNQDPKKRKRLVKMLFQPQQRIAEAQKADFSGTGGDLRISVDILRHAVSIAHDGIQCCMLA